MLFSLGTLSQVSSRGSSFKKMHGFKNSSTLVENCQLGTNCVGVRHNGQPTHFHCIVYNRSCCKEYDYMTKRDDQKLRYSACQSLYHVLFAFELILKFVKCNYYVEHQCQFQIYVWSAAFLVLAIFSHLWQESWLTGISIWIWYPDVDVRWIF